MIRIRIPSAAGPELTYITGVLLRDFLGLEIEYEIRDELHAVEFLMGGSRLVLPQDLLSEGPDNWLSEEKLPHTPPPKLEISNLKLQESRFCEHHLPVLFGQAPKPESPESWIDRGSQGTTCFLDLLGSCFFLLTRMEETVRLDQDEHQRYPTSACYLARNDLLSRPLVHEYLEVLWSLMQELAPQLVRKQHRFFIRPGHDVDNPFALPASSWTKILRQTGGDLRYRRSIMLAGQRLGNALRCSLGLKYKDVNNNFDWLMDTSERHGTLSTFYFLAGGTSRFDRRYKLDQPRIRELMKGIHERGHAIGLHASYSSFGNSDQLHKEHQHLQETLEQLHIPSQNLGGRAHYLRWRAPESWQAWHDAGLHHDASTTYEQAAGFRCGCCYPYPAFNVRSRQTLAVTEHPLILMDTTLLHKDCMGKSADQAKQFALDLKQRVRKYNGVFEILWHNDWQLDPRKETCLYEEILSS